MWLTLLRLLVGWRRCRLAAHIRAMHHAWVHRFHLFLHPVHVVNQRFPHLHVVSPARQIVRVPDRESVGLHLCERGLHLLHVGLHGRHLFLMHLHHLLATLLPRLGS